VGPRPSDPLTALPWGQRLRLRWSLRREWRAGIAARRKSTLERIRDSVLGTSPQAVNWSGPTTDIYFGDGTILRLGPCHRPAVRALRAAMDAGGAYLAQVSDHGRCWGVYFASPAGWLGLLSSELLVDRSGGRSRASVSPLAPGGRRLTLIG